MHLVPILTLPTHSVHLQHVLFLPSLYAFFSLLLLLASIIALCACRRSFGIGILHLLSLFLFQGCGIIATILGYRRLDNSFESTIYGQIAFHLCFYLIGFTGAYLVKPIQIIPSHSRPSFSTRGLAASWARSFSALKVCSLFEISLYLLIFVANNFNGRIDLTQVQKIPYYLSVFVFMYALSRGIPTTERLPFFLWFIFPKIFIGFMGWRGAFAWIGLPYVFLAWGFEFSSYLRSLISSIQRFRLLTRSFIILLFAASMPIVFIFLPLIGRGDFLLLSNNVDSTRFVLAELLGSPFMLGFYNQSANIAHHHEIYWPLSSFFDSYLNPLFHISPLFDASPVNLPIRYDRYMSSQLLDSAQLAAGIGTGGSLTGELLASGNAFHSCLIGLVIGCLSKSIDNREFYPFFTIAARLPSFMRFAGYWIATKILYLPRGTIPEVVDVIPILLLAYVLLRFLDGFLACNQAAPTPVDNPSLQ